MMPKCAGVKLLRPPTGAPMPIRELLSWAGLRVLVPAAQCPLGRVFKCGDAPSLGRGRRCAPRLDPGPFRRTGGPDHVLRQPRSGAAEPPPRLVSPCSVVTKGYACGIRCPPRQAPPLTTNANLLGVA